MIGPVVPGSNGAVGAPDAAGTTEAIRFVSIPGTAAQYTILTTPGPSGIFRRAFLVIVLIIPVTASLHDIPRHVVKPVRAHSFGK